MQKLIRFLMLLGLAGVAAASARAQWTSQTIPLRAGWNAVFLEVQPEPRLCDVLFAGLQVESVWRFNRQVGTVQFITDPDKLVPNQPDWLTYLPLEDPLSGKSRLHVIEGGRPYLIKRSDNAAPANWTVRGRPIHRPIAWLPDSLNLVGFPLATQSSVTYQSFFAHAPALATNFVYRLSPGGIWVRLNAPASTPMSAGEAFWIHSTGPCDYAGTLSLDLERKSGLSFGRVLIEDSLRIRNASTRPATITVRTLASESPAATGEPALAGSVPLSYWLTDVSRNHVGWTNLPAQLVRNNVPPGGQWELRLAIRRRDMARFVAPPGVSEVLYQSILEISDGVTCLRVPVTAEGLSVASAEGAPLKAGQLGTASAPAPASVDRTGLWIGSAILNKVNEPQNLADPQAPVPTASALQFRLIIHVNEQGQPRLLQKVLQRWQDGTLKPAGDGSTNLVVDQPGRFVLLTDEARAAQFKGAGLRDGQEVGRRFSTAAFAVRQPIPLACTGEFGADASVCAASVVVRYDDPLNPFVHRYHPDHDNLTDRYTPLAVRDLGRGPQTAESYTVTRQIEMQFSGQDPDGLNVAGWGDSRLGGVYRETFIGLHRDPLIAEGTFQLFRVSPVGVLDP